MTKTIDYYHFLISPWSYLAIDRFNQIVAKHNATVNYKPIAVMPTFDKMGGVPPGKRHPSRQRLRMDELQRWSTHLNMPMNFTPAFFPADCSLASKMVIATDQKDAGALSDAVLTAVWKDEQNVADEAVLHTLATGCGLDADALIATAKSDELVSRFEQVTNEAHERDVFGSPTYIIDGEIFWGQDRLDFLDRKLEG